MANSAKDGKQAGLSRRDLGALAAAGFAASGLLSRPAPLAAQSSTAAAPKVPLDLAEWSYFWVGVERATLASGTYVSGKQMYVEYWVPSTVRHPYPVVCVHGGGGQGTDWMGTPDGRPGWATYLAQEGFRVYVVDRPGHGRSPIHPMLHGGFPQQMVALEDISGRFTPPNSLTKDPNQFRKYHNQWPGTGEIGSADLDQFLAGQGGSYVMGPAGPAPAALQHQVWRECGAELLDKIGPAVFITNSAGGAFGWLVAEARPNLVKGTVVIEGGGQPFGGANVWGMSTIPVAYDPPVSDPSEIKRARLEAPEPGVGPYFLQAEPARKLKNLQNVPIVIVTSEGSFASPGNPGAVAFFKQAGCQAEEMRLASVNIHGNGHVSMLEKNNRQVLQPVLDWIRKNVEKSTPVPAARGTETAMRVAEQGLFWVGTEHKKVSYGTILTGQMYVQYLIPQQVRSRYPIVLVHGGTGQMLHYMGSGDGKAGWAHYYVQAGYPVYLVDRPGHGRAPYHPDALGPIGPQPAYGGIVAEFKRATTGPNRRWSGTGDIGDPLVDQFMASQNGAPQDNLMAHRLWASRGAELLDKIGPAIIQVHSAGGPFGYLVANERPNLVKAIVNVEGGGAAFTGGNVWGVTDVPMVFDPPATDPSQLMARDVTPESGLAYKLQADGNVRKLKNLQGIPIVYVTAEKSGRAGGPGHVAFLKQAGCDAEHLALKEKGILGNGHFMMIEENRKQVFDAIQEWVAQKIKA